MAQIKLIPLLIGALLATPAGALAQQAAIPSTDVQARTLMGSGQTGSATRMMRDHVAHHPEDQAAVLDLARYLTWNGDYAGAKQVLDTHPQASRTAEGQVVLAGVLAWAGWIHAAQQFNAPPLAADPEGLLPNYTQALILRQSARPREALPYVEVVKRARPGGKDARDLERSVHIHTDSFIALDYQHGSDSDHLGRSQPTVRGELAQGDALRWTLELGRWDYRAPLSSPFASINGARSISETRGLVGIRYAPSLYTTLSAAVGSSSIRGNDQALWRLALDHRISDTVRVNLLADHDRLAASPRSISLGLARTGIAGHAQWTPDLNWTGDLWLRRDHFSDSNASVDLNAALRRAVVRAPGFMLDVGASAEHLSFDRNPAHGYYAPDNYRRYALTANLYVGLGENAGLAVQAGLGRQRDETFTSWRRANDISASLVIGIFSTWQLSVNTGYSQRMLNTGAYEGRSWGATLTHRF